MPVFTLASTFLWSAVDNLNVTGESTFTQTTSIITDVLINITFLPETVQYTVQPTGTNSCAGNPFTITVNVNPAAKISAGRDIDVCSNVTSVTLEGVSTFAPNGVFWSAAIGSYAPGSTVPSPVYTHGSNF